MTLRAIFLGWVLVVAASNAAAAEEASTLHVRTRDALGSAVEADIALTILRPAGLGPFPAVVLSHGRPPEAVRKQMGRVKLSAAATTLLGLGLVVIVPTRIGYGVSAGPDVEFSVSCEQPQYAETFAAVADQIAATVEHARKLPYVDPQHIYLVGHSMGGAGTVAAAARGLPGVRAAAAFNSGQGARGRTHPGEPCGVPVLQSTFASLGGQRSPAPVLWAHTENDQQISLVHAREWFDAFIAAGGQGSFVAFPAYRADGHDWFIAEPGGWRDAVQSFFAANGLRRAP